MYFADFFTYCQSEYNAKLKIREEQAEGRRQRLEEKKAILERMEHPPEAEPTKLDRKGKQQKKLGVPAKLEPIQESERLPYLPTPDEIILQQDGAFLDETYSLLHCVNFSHYDDVKIITGENVIFSIFLRGNQKGD